MLQEDREYVLSLGAKFIEEDIFYIDNFLSKDIIDLILNECYEESKWNLERLDDSYIDMFDIKNPDVIKKLEDLYEKFWKWPSIDGKYNNIEFQDVKWVKRRGIGAIPGMAPHWDGDPSPKYTKAEKGSIKIPNRVKWGCVLYLNDNFVGGEINYIKKGIQFKPVAGTLICHRADHWDYIHKVNDITDGMRYNMIMNVLYGDVNEPEPGEEIYSFNK